MAERITGHTELIGLMAYLFVTPAHRQCRTKHLQNWVTTTHTWHFEVGADEIE